MMANEIKVDGEYMARVSGRYVTVRVTAIRKVERAGREVSVFDVMNLSTGRTTTFDSAAKFRCEAKKVEVDRPFAVVGAPESAVGVQVGAVTQPAVNCERAEKLTEHISKGEFHIMDAESENKAAIESLALRASGAPCGLPDFITPEVAAQMLKEVKQRPDPTPTGSLCVPSVERLGVAVTTELTESPALTAASPVAVEAAPVSKLAQRIAASNAGSASEYEMTAEQKAGIDAALEIEGMTHLSQRVLVLKAGAGCGKTWELQQLEKLLRGIGQYTAYNAPLVADSTPKFKRAACNTTHSLAFRAVGFKYKHRLNTPRVRSYEIASKLGIEDQYVLGTPYPVNSNEWCEAAVNAGYGSDNPPPKHFCPRPSKRIKAAWLAGQVMEAVKRFCQSADSEITARHFKFIPGVDDNNDRTNNNQLKSYLLPFALRMWDDIADPNGMLPFSHDCYVKLWQLGTGKNKPVIAADYVMLDEYQDTAPVMVNILKQQTHALIILVGDDNQRIYEWRGAINAGDEFPHAPRRNLSKSFRFGQVVADVANAVLAGLEEPTDLVMAGFEKIPSRICAVPNPRCYLYRTNAGAVGRLMSAKADGKRGHLIGGSKEVIAFCKAAIQLQAGQGTDHPELGCFSNWNEVVEYSKTDEGGDLRLMVKLIDAFGAAEIKDALENMPSEEQADLICSTAHRSKGREWTSVKLGQDFKTANLLDDAERRLIYVAATRAQEELDITECPTFCGGYDKGYGEDGEKRWIPGIPIHYTIEMPTEEELTAYRADKAAKKASAATTQPTPVNTPVAAPTPAVAAPAPANGNGQYSWANVEGGWRVRGPANQPIGARVTVVRRDGSRSTVTIGEVVKKLGDLWFYAVN